MKVLIIRFSSIGDIVLTTPVVRCLKKQLDDVEIHYLTKPEYVPLLEGNPYISKVITLPKRFGDLVALLRAESYDHIIDLHKNLRTHRLGWMLFRGMHSFPKLNVRKWLRVRLKWDVLPRIHIVDRYLKAVEFLGVKNDGQGLDHFIPEAAKLPSDIVVQPPGSYLVMVVGAKQFTKQIPEEKIILLGQEIKMPIFLVGGNGDINKAGRVAAALKGRKVTDVCGRLSLNESALLIRDARAVITGDTGMMHIAAALKKEVISIWGNTLPEFGMYPYFPRGMEGLAHIIELKGLSCRPCTKLGYDKCPKSHFKCMMHLQADEILKILS